jgi:RecB family exonuclease
MGAAGRLALSAPRQWLDGRGREVSGVLLEAAMALGRSAAGGGVPTSADLRSHYFALGVDRRARWARERPVLPAGILRTARGAAPGCYLVPPDWLRVTGPLRLAELCRLDAERDDRLGFGATDGDLARVWDAAQAPGITAARPLSPSKLTVLLACPYRFLLRHLLGYDEPVPPAVTDRIEPMAFGSLVHKTMELFLERHGDDLCQGKGTDAGWRKRIAKAAAARFDEFQVTCSLRGAGAVESERRRLINAVQRLVSYEFNREPRTYVAAEWGFGDPEAVALELGDEVTMYTRGTIDRIDRLADDTYSVRDYKTGRVRSLNQEEAGQLSDLQIALYAAVLEATAAAASPSPVSEAVYVHSVAVRDPERRFDGDELARLRQQVEDWLRVSCRLLADGVFPRTADPGQCSWCPFEPHCGTDAPVIAEGKLSQPDAPAAARLFAQRLGLEVDEPGEVL